MLLLRLRWCIAGNGGFELIIFKLLSEHPRPPPSLLSTDVKTDESDEMDIFFRVFIIVESFWWDDANVCLATVLSDNKSLSSLSGWGESSSSVCSQDRSSLRPLPNDLRNLSTKRIWNLFKLPWLPVDGFGGLQFFVGLVSELCDVRDDVRENARELLRLI